MVKQKFSIFKFLSKLFLGHVETLSLETSKILDSGEIIHTITKEDISNFLTTFGDVLSDDDMKDFCAEFDGINSGMIFFKKIDG